MENVATVATMSEDYRNSICGRYIYKQRRLNENDPRLSIRYVMNIIHSLAYSPENSTKNLDLQRNLVVAIIARHAFFKSRDSELSANTCAQLPMKYSMPVLFIGYLQ